jgi:hypothetical protein
MSDAQLFSIANTGALLSWIVLAVAPGRAAPVLRYIVPGALAVLYIWAIGTSLPGTQGGFDSLANVKQLFTSDRAVLAGWVHYLAFDLFIGCWEVLDARERGIKHAFVLPCLALTFMVGPAGLLLYFLVRRLGKERETGLVGA